MQQFTDFSLKISFTIFLLAASFEYSTAQETAYQSDSTSVEDSVDNETPEATTEPDVTALKEEALPDESQQNLHQVIRNQFINGDWRFMTPVLLCLLIGLVITIERIIRLNLATSNVDQIIGQLKADLEAGGVNQARQSLQSTSNSVIMIFGQSMEKWSEGIEVVEKAIISYGSVEMGKLEKGLVWISLFISIAPMLGFMGTVIGMINAFDAIEAAGDISPTLVASGIKTALLTTVAGLIVAIILQLFYNYCVAKIDSLVNDMEWASISFVDILVDYQTSQAAGKLAK